MFPVSYNRSHCISLAVPNSIRDLYQWQPNGVMNALISNIRQVDTYVHTHIDN